MLDICTSLHQCARLCAMWIGVCHRCHAGLRLLRASQCYISESKIDRGILCAASRLSPCTLDYFGLDDPTATHVVQPQTGSVLVFDNYALRHRVNMLRGSGRRLVCLHATILNSFYCPLYSLEMRIIFVCANGAVSCCILKWLPWCVYCGTW